MKVLAIESSAVTASVAIMTEDTLIAEYTINYKKTHSQTLLPMIDEICRMTETDVSDIDIVAVSDGPGSFTGLRMLRINLWWLYLRLRLWLIILWETKDLYALSWMQEDSIFTVVYTDLMQKSLKLYMNNVLYRIRNW